MVGHVGKLQPQDRAGATRLRQRCEGLENLILHAYIAPRIQSEHQRALQYTKRIINVSIVYPNTATGVRSELPKSPSLGAFHKTPSPAYSQKHAKHISPHLGAGQTFGRGLRAHGVHRMNPPRVYSIIGSSTPSSTPRERQPKAVPTARKDTVTNLLKSDFFFTIIGSTEQRPYGMEGVTGQRSQATGDISSSTTKKLATAYVICLNGRIAQRRGLSYIGRERRPFLGRSAEKPWVATVVSPVADQRIYDSTLVRSVGHPAMWNFLWRRLRGERGLVLCVARESVRANKSGGFKINQP